MKRRDFSLAAASLAFGSLAGTAAAQGTGNAFQAGTDYAVLKKRASVGVPAGKVEVVEFFSYNCPHCAEFEPSLEAWTKRLPAQVVFRRVPVPFVGRDVETKQRLYYTLEAMGQLDAFHAKLFVAIHQQHERLFGDEAVLAWAKKQPGLDAGKFTEIFRSFSMASKLKSANQLQADYGVNSVPSIGVAGRWYVDADLTKTLDRMLKVTDFLIDQARKA